MEDTLFWIQIYVYHWNRYWMNHHILKISMRHHKGFSLDFLKNKELASFGHFVAPTQKW